jgi:hypothetical protein
MKYVKLFETWLNEADAPQQGAATPFKIETAGTFPVLSITQENLYGKGPEDLQKVLKSILERSLDKKSTLEGETNKVTLTSYMMNEFATPNGINIEGTKTKDKQKLILSNNAEFKKGLDEIAIENDKTDQQFASFFIYTSDTPENKLFWKSDSGNGISTQSAAFVSFPKPTASVFKGDALAIDLPIFIVAGGKSKVITLGQLCALTTSKFADLSILDKKDVGTKEKLAANIFPEAQAKA